MKAVLLRSTTPLEYPAAKRRSANILQSYAALGKQDSTKSVPHTQLAGCIYIVLISIAISQNLGLSIYYEATWTLRVYVNTTYVGAYST